MSISHALRTLAVLAAALSLCSPPALAQKRSVASIEARQWTAEPSGGFSVSGGDLSETFDFKNDLGLDEDDAMEGRLVFRPSRRTMVRIGFLPELEFSGDNVVSRSITFFDLPFNLNERVISNFTLEYGRLGFAWQFASASEGRFRLGPLIEVKGLRGDLMLSAPDAFSPVFEEDHYEVAFGAAGLIAEWELSDRLELFGEATESVTGDEGDVTETEYGVRVLVLPKLMVVAGARTLEIDFQDGTQNFVFELDGVFLGAQVRF